MGDSAASATESSLCSKTPSSEGRHRRFSHESSLCSKIPGPEFKKKKCPGLDFVHPAGANPEGRLQRSLRLPLNQKAHPAGVGQLRRSHSKGPSGATLARSATESESFWSKIPGVDYASRRATQRVFSLPNDSCLLKRLSRIQPLNLR